MLGLDDAAMSDWRSLEKSLAGLRAKCEKRPSARLAQMIEQLENSNCQPGAPSERRSATRSCLTLAPPPVRPATVLAVGPEEGASGEAERLCGSTPLLYAAVHGR